MTGILSCTPSTRRSRSVRSTLRVTLPGNHAPRGPIDGLAGLIITAGGHAVEWLRDAVNVYAFHVQVPAGVSRLELEFEFASPLVRDQGRTVVTPDMVGLNRTTPAWRASTSSAPANSQPSGSATEAAIGIRLT